MNPSFPAPQPQEISILVAEKRQQLLIQLSRAIKKIERKVNHLTLQLEDCLKWSSVQHQGELIKANLSQFKQGMDEVQVFDWLTETMSILILKKDKTPVEQMEAFFKAAKKLERGIEPLTYQLAKTKHELSQLKEMVLTISKISDFQELEVFENDKLFHKISQPPIVQRLLKKTAPSPIYMEYISKSGFKIWVGRNAKANDQLTFRLANGRDLWMHARGCPGSHVVIRLGKEEAPDSETLLDALQLALHYSRARQYGECEVLYTKRKFVVRAGKIKGKREAGKVQVSTHRTSFVRFDQERFQRLKERG